MRKYRRSFALLAVTILVAALLYWHFQPQTNHHPQISGPPGSISWKLLAKARDYNPVLDDHYMPRYYPQEIRQLVGKKITVRGFMFPIRSTKKFDYFLLEAYPSTCPYCAPAGPSEIITVHSASPVTVSWDPITIRGILKLYEDDLSKGFYGLDEAEIISNP